MGVWIEIIKHIAALLGDTVTPFVGVWIEIVHIKVWRKRK